MKNILFIHTMDLLHWTMNISMNQIEDVLQWKNIQNILNIHFNIQYILIFILIYKLLHVWQKNKYAIKGE